MLTQFRTFTLGSYTKQLMNRLYVLAETRGKDYHTYATFIASMAGDARMFIEGRYSEMSKEAKNIIYNTSTLPYNKNMGSFKNTDPILQALDKTRTLRVWLQSRLGLKELPESSELITKPLNDWFIEYRLKKHV